MDIHQIPMYSSTTVISELASNSFYVTLSTGKPIQNQPKNLRLPLIRYLWLYTTKGTLILLFFTTVIDLELFVSNLFSFFVSRKRKCRRKVLKYIFIFVSTSQFLKKPISVFCFFFLKWGKGTAVPHKLQTGKTDYY